MWALIGNNAVPRKSIPLERFDGIRAIQAHINKRNQVEAYVHGYSPVKPVIPEDCCADCPVGKWLHSAGGNHCTDLGLLNALHESCHEFHEAAAQAVLLAELGENDQAISIVRGSRFFSDASDRYQSNLAKLHLACEMV